MLCSHGQGPHLIKVFIFKKDNGREVMSRILDTVGPKPVKEGTKRAGSQSNQATTDETDEATPAKPKRRSSKKTAAGKAKASLRSKKTKA